MVDLLSLASVEVSVFQFVISKSDDLPAREVYAQSYLFVASSGFPVGHKLYIL